MPDDCTLNLDVQAWRGEYVVLAVEDQCAPLCLDW
jgi:hypothetical protein